MDNIQNQKTNLKKKKVTKSKQIKLKKKSSNNDKLYLLSNSVDENEEINNKYFNINNNENQIPEKKLPKKKKVKHMKKSETERNSINTIDSFEFDDFNKAKFNRSAEEFKTFESPHSNNPEYIMERSNSFIELRKFINFNKREKISNKKLNNGINCLIEINQNNFALGNLIGDIIILNKKNFIEILTIREHNGTIISLNLLHDKSVLSCSADRTMKKIRISPNGKRYLIEFIFTGYNDYILKGIELMNSYKIVTCSWDNQLNVWSYENISEYKNILIFNNEERVQDLLEINDEYFVSISDDNNLKYWNSENFKLIDIVNNIKCIGAPNALCKLNDNILCVLDYHEIQLVDIKRRKLINNIIVNDGNLSCVIKLNDNSILVAEDYNTDNYCVFYMKQLFYGQGELHQVSYKKNTFYKTNKNNDKEIRALLQFYNGIIVLGVTGEFSGKDYGELTFYY